MPPSRLSPTIVAAPNEVKVLWSAFAEESIAGAAQSPAWYFCWQASVNSDCLVAALCNEKRPVLLLPLEIERKGGLRIASYVGGPHANCNFPALAPGQSVTRADLVNLFKALHTARPDIDLVTLARQLGELADTANPIIQLSSRQNPNVSLAIRLDVEFDTLLGRHNPKRKIKKHKYVARRFSDAGGYRIVTASSASETEAMLDKYFAWKADRLARAGIRNTYEPKGVMPFFHRLFAEEAASPSPAFELRALEVANEYRAVLGKSHARDRTFIDFVGIADDELTSISPGEFLFYEDIEKSCGTDLAIYSFGIGDEPYKRSWSDLESPTFDTDFGLTARGQIYGIYLGARRTLVRRIKQSPKVWSFVKAARTRLRGHR